MGYTMNVRARVWVLLFEVDNDGNPTLKTNDKGSYFDLGPIDLGENARRDMTLALEDMGFEIETSHHEVAAGQNEIDFKYAIKYISDSKGFWYVVPSVKYALIPACHPHGVFCLNSNLFNFFCS
mgnify:CR=1 FL=1